MQGNCFNNYLRIALGFMMVFVAVVGDVYGQSNMQQVQVNPGESVRLNVFSEGATSYVWLQDDHIIDHATDSYYMVTEPGIYSAIAYNDFQCASVQSNLVEVIFRATDTEHSIEHFCELSNPTVLDIEIGVEDLIWFSDKGGQNSLSADAPLIDGVTYYAKSMSTGLNYSVQIIMDACLDIAIDKSVDAVEAAMDTQVNFTIVVSNNSRVKGENLVIKEQLPDGYLYEDHQLTSGRYSSVSGLWEIVELGPEASEQLKLRARLVEGQVYQNTAELIHSEPEDFKASNNVSSASVEATCVKVFEIFTPNNDGNNDTFVIRCIEQYPNNILKVYDKDGSLVYSKQGYDNSWRGYSNSNWTLNKSDPLPAGVYFYILDLGNNTKATTGWIFLGY